MTDKLLCPFCQQELKDQWVGQYVAHEYFDCSKCKLNGNRKLWQALIDARKKLDIAVKALKVYSSESGNWWYGYEFQGHYEDYAGEYADKALEQIKEKEEK